MKIKEIAKNVLLGKTCDKCGYYYKNYYIGINGEKDPDAENYCHCSNNGLGPDIPLENTCSEWKEYV